MTGKGHSDVQALFAEIEPPECRAVYVLDRLRQCRGISSHAMNRGFELAGRALGLGFDEGRHWLRHALVSGPAVLIPHTRKLSPRDVGYVYVAKDVARSDIVKIGFTRNPEDRRKRLSALCRADIQFLSTSPGIMLDEHVEHCRLHRARVFGEWFRAEAVLH